MGSVSSKIINTCIWGVDIPTKEELISYNSNECEIAKEIGADSVKFLSLEDLGLVFDGPLWCRNCFLKERL